MSVSFEWSEGTEKHRLNVKKGSMPYKVLMSVIDTVAHSSNESDIGTGGAVPDEQWLANLHRTSAEILHDLALLLNLLLLYLIVKHSRFQTGAYKYILGLACGMDIVLAVAAVLSRPVCFVSGGYMLLISEGIGSTNSTVAFYTMLFWVSALHANIIGVAVQFAWRYKVVCSRTTSLSASSKLLLWAFPTAYSIFGAFVIGRTMTSTADYPATAEHILRELPWTRPDGTIPHSFGSYVMHPIMAVYCGMFSMTAVGSYSIVVWTEWKIMKFLGNAGDGMIEATRRMHAEVHRALIATALSPLLACAPVIFFVTCFIFKTSPGPITAFIISVYNMIALVNPIMQIYFVRSYRQAVLSAGWRVFPGCAPKRSTIAPATNADGLSLANSAVHPSNPAATH